MNDRLAEMFHDKMSHPETDYDRDELEPLFRERIALHQLKESIEGDNSLSLTEKNEMFEALEQEGIQIEKTYI